MNKLDIERVEDIKDLHEKFDDPEEQLALAESQQAKWVKLMVGAARLGDSKACDRAGEQVYKWAELERELRAAQLERARTEMAKEEFEAQHLDLKNALRDLDESAGIPSPAIESAAVRRAIEKEAARLGTIIEGFKREEQDERH